MRRKAAFEMPITYIYVILVGGFALFLFANIAFQTGEAGMLSNARDIARYFDAVVETLSEDTNRMGHSGDVLLERFSIIVDDSNRSRVRYKNAEQILKSNVFSKEELFGNISFWTYPFKTGYTSSTIVFIADQRTKYYFVYDGSDTYSYNLQQALRSELPMDYEQLFPIMFVDSGILPGIITGSNEKIICLGPLSPANCHMRILPADENYPMYGTIHDTNSGAESSYHNYGMVFAAAFAHNMTTYKKGISIAKQRHKINGEIIKKKIDGLLDENLGLYCDTRYNNIRNIILELEDANTITTPANFHNARLQMFKDNDELRAHRDCTPVF
jgi:hypothetical protein